MKQQVDKGGHYGNGNSQGSCNPLIAYAACKYDSQYHYHNYKTGRQIRLFKDQCRRNGKQYGCYGHSADLINLFLVFHEIPGKGYDKAYLNKL